MNKEETVIMQLEPHEVHIYSVDLAEAVARQASHIKLLTPDENKRAERFRFTLHRQRFIAARASLRLILSQYLSIAPEKICFAYSSHHKPSLSHPSDTNLQFNLAHSSDFAIYAVALEQALGVDVEVIEARQVAAIAERFFSPQENEALNNLAPADRVKAFYHIWSCKEAIIKATGKGLSQPLSSFSIPLTNEPSKIDLDNQVWSLVPLSLSNKYSAALASNQPIQSIKYFTLDGL